MGLSENGDLVLRVEDAVAPWSPSHPGARTTPLGAYPLICPDPANATCNHPHATQRPVLPGTCMMIFGFSGATWYNSRRVIILHVDHLHSRALVVMRHSGFVLMIALKHLGPITPAAPLLEPPDASTLAQCPY